MASVTYHYPHIPYKGANISSPTAETGYDANAITSGSRAKIFRSSAASTTSVWSWDFTTTISPNYLIVAHADYLTKRDTANISYTVRGSIDSGFVTGTSYTGTISTASLIGSGNADSYIALTTTAYRYWRVNLVTTASFKHQVSKIYLGTLFDTVRDPTYSTQITREATIFQDKPITKLQLVYNGVKNTDRAAFFDTIISTADVKEIFIYDPSTLVLMNQTLLHCFVTSSEITRIGLETSDFNITVEESIG